MHVDLKHDTSSNYRNKGGVQPFFKIMYEYLLNVQTYLFVLSYLNAYWYIC